MKERQHPQPTPPVEMLVNCLPLQNIRGRQGDAGNRGVSDLPRDPVWDGVQRANDLISGADVQGPNAFDAFLNKGLTAETTVEKRHVAEFGGALPGRYNLARRRRNDQAIQSGRANQFTA